MLSSTMTVLEENEESLLSDLALITDCAGTGQWVHFGHRKMPHCIVNTDTAIVDAAYFLSSMQDALNDKLLTKTCIKKCNKHYLCLFSCLFNISLVSQLFYNLSVRYKSFIIVLNRTTNDDAEIITYAPAYQLFSWYKKSII